MMIRKNVFFVVSIFALCFLVSGCANNRQSSQESREIFLWSDSWSTIRLYLMDPGAFDTKNSEPPEPVATIYNENITVELNRALRDIEVLPNPKGPFPECAPEPGVQFFYLTIEDEPSDLRRFAQNHGCGGIGVGYPGQTGFFQQPLDGRLSLDSFCVISDFIGVSSTSCSP